MDKKKERIISLLVNNKPDVLARVAGTLGGKGYNIESLCVDVTMNPDVSKIILTTVQTKSNLSKIEKQLERLIDVVKVEDLTEVETIKQEMVLIRMNLTETTKSELIRTINALNCKIITFNTDHCVLEYTGSKDAVDAILKKLAPLGIDDIARTGVAALERKN
ncbi:MAG TPA: acetolactate synthase small subunit [Syntrophales bacterium]|nr:acetolactate synthase small subunit [Syntrophales bacterium]HOX93392.1 acetolactate synthase small subunit [Syntrophales bacterium]HPI56063.1 acetolactate synthase small subunit [Syntrophales bacterium]HPN24047.1 acetolactate synthase small subunit [Syntrophales bacterium]HQM28326.1 acetolactate synthase small subunit [Syntrophales bacterium]